MALKGPVCALLLPWRISGKGREKKSGRRKGGKEGEEGKDGEDREDGEEERREGSGAWGLGENLVGVRAEGRRGREKEGAANCMGSLRIGIEVGGWAGLDLWGWAGLALTIWAGLALTASGLGWAGGEDWGLATGCRGWMRGWGLAGCRGWGLGPNWGWVGPNWWKGLAAILKG